MTSAKHRRGFSHRPRWTCRSYRVKTASSWRKPLDHGRHALADADAHRREAVARAADALELVDAARRTSRAPLAPSGWPTAIAPPFTLTRSLVEPELAHARERPGAANASFSSTRSRSATAEAGRASTLRDRRDRADAHHARARRRPRRSRRARAHAAGRARAAYALLGEHHRGGTVVDARGVAGGHRAALAERRAAARPASRRSCRGADARRARRRVPRPCAPGTSTAHDLVARNVRRPGRAAQRCCAAQRQCVLIGARDAVALGDVLAGLAHRVGAVALLHAAD